ncbi:hypothetical protein [Thermococcus piezophilus]|uniref:hypothetical protein n=1 Tax=Thermococcus piezophilus TaxID=1712654 RepID=UPI000B284798|nr:hypothetical protein [Thermococcus piezophilus]
MNIRGINIRAKRTPTSVPASKKVSTPDITQRNVRNVMNSALAFASLSVKFGEIWRMSGFPEKTS